MTAWPEYESAALEFLQKRGLVLVARNFRCRTGEIDLVMMDGDTLVFVEVRARASPEMGSAAESITPAKRRRILSAARYYLMKHDAQPDCRFDAVLFEGKDEPEWIRGAFMEAEDRFR